VRFWLRGVRGFTSTGLALARKGGSGMAMGAWFACSAGIAVVWRCWTPPWSRLGWWGVWQGLRGALPVLGWNACWLETRHCALVGKGVPVLPTRQPSRRQ